MRIECVILSASEQRRIADGKRLLRLLSQIQAVVTHSHATNYSQFRQRTQAMEAD